MNKQKPELVHLGKGICYFCYNQEAAMPELTLGLCHRWAESREVPVPGGSLRNAALGFPAKERVVPESGWNRGRMSLHCGSQASRLGI